MTALEEVDAARHVVDVHAHFLPDIYRRALADAGLDRLDGGMPIPAWSAQSALEVMDRHGIDRAILSVSSPGVGFCPDTQEIALALSVNDAAATLAADSKGRFGGFATLPLGHPQAAVREIDRALDDLGLDGFILPTNYKGLYPGDASWITVLEALDARGALVLLHPTSHGCMECLGGGRPAPLIEFPFDTTRAVVDLIYSGQLARLPAVRFILSHGGGTLPYLADRIAGFSALPAMSADPALDPPAVRAALGRMHYDTALAATPIHVAAIRRIAPIANIVFGSDWPFSPDTLIGQSLQAIAAMDELDATDREAVLSGNARRLLGQAAV